MRAGRALAIIRINNGADANGFYITTNEFNFFAPRFPRQPDLCPFQAGTDGGDSDIGDRLFDTANFTLEREPRLSTVWAGNLHRATSYSGDAGGTESTCSAELRTSSSTRSDSRLRIWAVSNTQSAEHRDSCADVRTQR